MLRSNTALYIRFELCNFSAETYSQNKSLSLVGNVMFSNGFSSVYLEKSILMIYSFMFMMFLSDTYGRGSQQSKHVLHDTGAAGK